jgi:hypothetical protein
MPFAAVTRVKLEGRDVAEDQKFLNEMLIPRLKALTGFQSARFMRSQDGTTGAGAVIFDTESNARAALDAMMTERPADAPPIENTAIYEVVLEV